MEAMWRACWSCSYWGPILDSPTLKPQRQTHPSPPVLPPSADTGGDVGGDRVGVAVEDPPRNLISFGKMVQTHYPQSWSDLPIDLAGLVLRRLPSHVDRVRFAAVCRHWRFSRRQHCLPPPLPWLGFPDGTFFGLPLSDAVPESFNLPNSASYCISCGDWLVFSRNGTCSLIDPFSEVTLTLPNLSSFCPVDEPSGIINGRVIPEGEMPGVLLNMDAEISLHKVIVCSTLLVAAIVDIGPLRTVALCRPGSASWLVSGLGSTVLLVDMMFYEGKLYTTDKFKDLLAIDVGEDNDCGKLRVSRIERLLEGPPFSISSIPDGISYIDRYLVESHGAVLLVQRTISGSFDNDDMGFMVIEPVGIEFEVLEADFLSQSWVKVRSVGDDQVLFVGKSCSRSVCVSHYNLSGNFIFFLDDDSCDWFWKDAQGPCAAYDMRDGNAIDVTMLTRSGEDENMLAEWLFPSG